jgi:protein-L-isoaspartate(D-aspartate) O-methyltransferase
VPRLPQALEKIAVCHPKSRFRLNLAWPFRLRWLEPGLKCCIAIAIQLCHCAGAVSGSFQMQSADFANMRRSMVDSQLRTSGVTESWVLAAMGSVPREDFVPVTMRDIAYMDRAIALNDGTTLNPPVATALMLQAADIAPADQVLLIGAKNGYAHALLSMRTAAVHAAHTGDGLPKGTYSIIFVDGAAEILPNDLIASAQEDGRIVTGLVERGVTSLALGIVRGGQAAMRHIADSEIAPLPQFARKPEFVF